MTEFFQRIIAILLSSVSVISTFIGGLSFEKYELFKDIRYGEAERNIMDIYVPDSAYENEHNGVILYIHGGSWTGGNKEDMASKAKRFARKGYITASMNYTLYADGLFGKVTALTMCDEIGKAIKKIKAFSDEKELNITKLAVSGYSAGAHLSMLYGFSRANESAIELVFTANQVGPSDFHSEVWGSTGLASMLSGIEITAEMTDTQKEEVISLVSPTAYVTKDTVPSILAYGGTDMIVPSGNAERIKAAFETAGATHSYILYPLSNHGLGLDPLCEMEYINTVEEYCKEYFGY
ncbi:MAG: alpha/beta hydrolase [Clostridia bacterium]|nr:alpha/beta hydrolase [Clostridia bacterium]MBR6634279.1 alpha/beta hydrolase [Clostridia bacterium]